MSPDEPTAPQSPLDWSEDGQPRSRLYGDVYFSTEDGLAESRAVFLEGCGLPEAWAGRRRFVVGELGFGTGLNIAALLDLWRRTQPPGAHLHVFSIEAHPITAEEARRALARWPELGEVAELMTARWPGRARGVHRLELPELGVILDVWVTEAADALRRWSGDADAWFLDGFSPSLNPAMWTDEVLGLVAQRSAPGARAATFTVAGAVRRGLSQAGFEVEKRPGFGRKRERLEARLPGFAAEARGPLRVAVVGCGIAGASAARAVRALGAEPIVLDAVGAGAGGSGNPAALVTPRLDAGLGPPAELFGTAFARAVQLYEMLPAAIVARGVRQLVRAERDTARFAKVAASDLFEPDALRMTSDALDQTTALVVEPAPILAAWAGAPRIAAVAALDRTPAGWTLRDALGEEIATVEAVILAAGPGAQALAPELPLTPVRGQASWTTGLSAPAAAWGGYVLPLRDGLLFGATHDRDDAAADLRADDHARNLETLAQAFPELADQVRGRPLSGRAAVRATTPDRLPYAGALGEGLFALTGFGSRGFSLAPLLAEHVAALAVGAPSPLAADLARLVEPARLRRKASKPRRS